MRRALRCAANALCTALLPRATAEELAADDDDVRRALSDPAVVRAMQDPMVQHCLQVCRTEPHRLPEFTKSARVRNHLMVLKRAGVIQLE